LFLPTFQHAFQLQHVLSDQPFVGNILNVTPVVLAYEDDKYWQKIHMVLRHSCTATNSLDIDGLAFC
jgi:homoserine trans-succinylase